MGRRGTGVNRLQCRAFLMGEGAYFLLTVHPAAECPKRALRASATLVALEGRWHEAWQQWGCSLDNSVELDAFLRSVERRAYVMARGMVANREDALDVVQDSMMRFVRHYGDRADQEWRPLFFRILINRSRDWQRRHAVVSRVIRWLKPGDSDPADYTAGTSPTPEDSLAADQAFQQIRAGLKKMSARQREAFLLRCIEGLDVAATAAAMACSTGSVKTHYSRALAVLRSELGEDDGG